MTVLQGGSKKGHAVYQKVKKCNQKSAFTVDKCVKKLYEYFMLKFFTIISQSQIDSAL